MPLRLTYLTVTNAFAVLCLLSASDRDKNSEILVLRHQLAVLERQLGGQKVRFTLADRVFLSALRHRLGPATLRRMRLLVRPETVLRCLRGHGVVDPAPRRCKSGATAGRHVLEYVFARPSFRCAGLRLLHGR